MDRRDFIRAAMAGSALLPDLDKGSTFSGTRKKTKIKDHLWLWGQDAGSHHRGSPEGGYRLPGRSILGPREGAEYFGIDRMLRVSMSTGPFPPFDAEAEKIKDIKEVVWSAIGAGGANQYSVNDHSDIDEVLRMAGIYSNVSGAVLDDFFHGREDPGRKIGRHSIESIRSMRDRLHGFNNRKLDLWVVWYDYQLGFSGVDEYLDLVDIVTFWTWEGRNLEKMDENIEKCIRKTPGKKLYAGCYFWNYGERKPLTMDQMKHQLDRFYYWMKKGQIEGIIFCSNATVPDVGLDTAEYTRKWISEKGDERIRITVAG